VIQKHRRFAMQYYDVKNSQGTPLVLGVNPHGLFIFRHSQLHRPVVTFSWAECSELSFTEKKFSIQVRKCHKQIIIFVLLFAIEYRLTTAGARQGDQGLLLPVPSLRHLPAYPEPVHRAPPSLCTDNVCRAKRSSPTPLTLFSLSFPRLFPSLVHIFGSPSTFIWIYS
jgi:hypothetical protein